MHWILQLEMEQGNVEEILLEAMEELKLPHTIVKVVPFSHELIPDPEVVGKVTCYGGTTLRKISQARGWSPGFYWDNYNFTFEAWCEHWGTELLNHDSVVCRFEDVPLQIDRFFMRPCATDKTFTGMHLDWCDYLEWRKEVLSGEVSQFYHDLTLDTLVAVAPYRDINQECRFFIVNGKIVTGSFYKSIGWRKRISFYDSPWYAEDMERYVQDRINQWQPHKAFVLDIARIPGGSCKIIEVNALNSSGLYACDPKKIVLALEEMEA